MDLYLPTGRLCKVLTVFVIFNGFGSSFMRTSPQSQGWAKARRRTGFAGITLETTEGHDAEEPFDPSRISPQHAKDLHVDPQRLVVIAWSGNVSAGLPTVEDPRRKAVKAAVMYLRIDRCAPVRFESVPVLFVRAGLDQRPQINTWIESRCSIAANAPWTLLNYPAGHHGFDVFDDNDLSREIIEETFRFAQKPSADSYQSALHADSMSKRGRRIFTGDFVKAAALIAKSLPPILRTRGGAARLRDRADRSEAIQRGAHAIRSSTGHWRTRRARPGCPAARSCALDHDPEARSLGSSGLIRDPSRIASVGCLTLRC